MHGSHKNLVGFILSEEVIMFNHKNHIISVINLDQIS